MLTTGPRLVPLCRWRVVAVHACVEVAGQDRGVLAVSPRADVGVRAHNNA